MFPIFETLINTPGISNCIKDNKLLQIETLMSNGSKLGMYTLDNSLTSAYKCGKISKHTLIENISDKNNTL